MPYKCIAPLMPAVWFGMMVLVWFGLAFLLMVWIEARLVADNIFTFRNVSLCCRLIKP